MNKKRIVQVAGLLAASLCVPAQAGQIPQEKLNESAGTALNANNELTQQADEAISQLRAEGYSCSQATLLGLTRALGSDLTEKQIKALSTGFRGGIGRTYDDGTCGALTAGIMALGLYSADDNEKGVSMSEELFNHFKKTYGTVKCGDIVGKFKFSKCTGCCLCVGAKVVELLQREKVELSQAATITWNEALPAED